MKNTFRACLSFIFALALAACAVQAPTTGVAVPASGASAVGAPAAVDYQVLVQNFCGIAQSEVAALATVPSIATNDQTTLAKVSGTITTLCAVPPANWSDAWLSLATVAPTLTILYLNYHG